MSYLIAAYTAVWLILAFFITTLLLKNRRLMREIGALETRIEQMESKHAEDHAST